MAKSITVKCECTVCGGTGLYTGWNCHDGATSVCDTCKGTGATEISYIPFTGRKEKKGVTRVFSNVRWKHVYPKQHEFENGTIIDFSKYGCTYDDWKKGAEPKPLT